MTRTSAALPFTPFPFHLAHRWHTAFPACALQEIEAEVSGTVVKVLVENGDAVLPG